MAKKREKQKKKNRIDKIEERVDNMDDFVKNGLGFDSNEVKNIQHVLYLLRMSHMKQWELASNLQMVNQYLEEEELSDKYNEWMKVKQEEAQQKQEEAQKQAEAALEESNASTDKGVVVD